MGLVKGTPRAAILTLQPNPGDVDKESSKLLQ